MGKYDNIQTVPAAPELGNFIGQCGPKESGRFHYYVIGFGCLILAIASFIAPYTFLPPQKPDHESGLKIITALAVLFFLGLSGLLILLPVFTKPQVVFLFENGLIDRKGDVDRKISLADVTKMRIFEWYEHRFADRELNIRLEIADQKDMLFGSALQGDAEKIIAYLKTKIKDQVFKPFQP